MAKPHVGMFTILHFAIATIVQQCQQCIADCWTMSIGGQLRICGQWPSPGGNVHNFTFKHCHHCSALPAMHCRLLDNVNLWTIADLWTMAKPQAGMFTISHLTIATIVQHCQHCIADCWTMSICGQLRICGQWPSPALAGTRNGASCLHERPPLATGAAMKNRGVSPGRCVNLFVSGRRPGFVSRGAGCGTSGQGLCGEAASLLGGHATRTGRKPAASKPRVFVVAR